MLISVVQLGKVSYATGLKIQAELIAARKENRIPDALLLLEHTPVITLGRNAKKENILLSRELLDAKGVDLFETDRGGDVTFHGPGQLVGYPIFDLHGFPNTGTSSLKYLGAVDYVRKIEEVLIRTCLEYGIPTKRVKGLTGVWTDWNHTGDMQSPDKPMAQSPDSKIAAIGVHISRSVTSHGFALNVNTDLDYFKLIVPCGISDKPVTSLQRELDRVLDLDEVAQRVSRNFGRVFDRQMLPVNTVDELLGRALDTPANAPAELRAIHGDESTFA
ncbi:MAG TPA: lipoyl(octanoyl) transferase LipB [Terriglobales bacterium]|nr:lipoyl(octanoyl) transferase LipB [Terriglobales bacterium]